MPRAGLEDRAVIRAEGYKIERYEGAGGGWMLLDPDGDYLMIGKHGCVAPTEWEAVAEGLNRVRQDRGVPSGQLQGLLTADEYTAVMDTLFEEVASCERIAIETGEEPERAELLRSAIGKIALEVDANA